MLYLKVFERNKIYSKSQKYSFFRSEKPTGIDIFLLFYPVQGCETKDAKLVRMCLALMQRLVTNKVIDFKGARYITDTLWMLMEAGIEVIIYNTHNIR